MAFSALEALQAFGAGRQMALQDRTQRRAEDTYQRQERERTDLAGAYDVNTGNFDPARTRQAYANAGDMEGAQSFEQHMTATHGAQWAQARARLIAAPAFLANVRDEASFQAAIARAHGQGVDLANVPDHYDPDWVRDVVSLGERLQAQEHPVQPTEFQRDYTWLQANHPEQAAGFLDRRTAPAPLTVRNDDGTITIIPQGRPSASAAPVQQFTPQQLRQQADEAIAAGAPRDQVEAEYQRMIQGGPAPASGNFPREDGGAFDFRANP